MSPSVIDKSTLEIIQKALNHDHARIRTKGLMMAEWAGCSAEWRAEAFWRLMCDFGPEWAETYIPYLELELHLDRSTYPAAFELWTYSEKLLPTPQLRIQIFLFSALVRYWMSTGHSEDFDQYLDEKKFLKSLYDRTLDYQTYDTDKLFQNYLGLYVNLHSEQEINDQIKRHVVMIEYVLLMEILKVRRGSTTAQEMEGVVRSFLDARSDNHSELDRFTILLDLIHALDLKAFYPRLKSLSQTEMNDDFEDSIYKIYDLMITGEDFRGLIENLSQNPDDQLSEDLLRSFTKVPNPEIIEHVREVWPNVTSQSIRGILADVLIVSTRPEDWKLLTEFIKSIASGDDNNLNDFWIDIADNAQILNINVEIPEHHRGMIDQFWERTLSNFYTLTLFNFWHHSYPFPESYFEWDNVNSDCRFRDALLHMVELIEGEGVSDWIIAQRVVFKSGDVMSFLADETQLPAVSDPFGARMLKALHQLAVAYKNLDPARSKVLLNLVIDIWVSEHQRKGRVHDFCGADNALFESVFEHVFLSFMDPRHMIDVLDRSQPVFRHQPFWSTEIQMWRLLTCAFARRLEDFNQLEIPFFGNRLFVVSAYIMLLKGALNQDDTDEYVDIFKKIAKINPYIPRYLDQSLEMKTTKIPAVYTRCSNEEALNYMQEFGWVWFEHDDIYDWLLELIDKVPSAPLIRTVKTGRNDPCPCGSGKKYKKCCM
jgi:hypothetical protein